MQTDKGGNDLLVEFLTHSGGDPGAPEPGVWRWGGERALGPQVVLGTLDN